MKTIVASMVCAGAMTILVGCGSSGGSGGGGAACGGDIMGNWTITSATIDVAMSMFDADCPGATGKGTGIKLTGNAIYNADMTYTENATFDGMVTVDIPTSCLQGSATCADRAGAIMGDTFQSATCTSTGSACSCTAVFAPTEVPDTGTYSTTAAGLLSETSAGETTADESDYCVTGTTLTETPHAGSSSGITGTITLMKQ
jgi:hypothetical protein